MLNYTVFALSGIRSKRCLLCLLTWLVIFLWVAKLGLELLSFSMPRLFQSGNVRSPKRHVVRRCYSNQIWNGFISIFEVSESTIRRFTSSATNEFTEKKIKKRKKSKTHHIIFLFRRILIKKKHYHRGASLFSRIQLQLHLKNNKNNIN